VDAVVGDPPDRWHPVAWFGQAMVRRERSSWRDDRRSGVVHTVVGVTGAVAVAGILVAIGRTLAGRAGEAAVATTVAAAVIGARSLDRRAAEIHEALASGRLKDARGLLPTLVGRDPTGLSEAEIARAVVESVAENSVDAVVAPLLWAAVGGPAGAAAYRAVNTLDAMVGHRSSRYLRFGWASARLDDLANYLPARIAAAVVAALRPVRAAAVWQTVLHQAPDHPSPNAGVIEAAFAAALDLRLGGINNYGGRIEQRVALGYGRPATAHDIARARFLAHQLEVAVAAALLFPSVLRFCVQRSVGSGRSSKERR
jgi:adenosylcobinamide-phosphate synthase